MSGKFQYNGKVFTWRETGRIYSEIQIDHPDASGPIIFQLLLPPDWSNRDKFYADLKNALGIALDNTFHKGTGIDLYDEDRQSGDG